MRKPSCIITDIEGTTTPKTFVYDVLFPYFIENLNKLASCSNHASYKTAIKTINDTLKEENDTNLSEVKLENVLKSWVEEDRKHPGLKLLQGLIWEQGYQNDTLKGVVYNDVPEMLQQWNEQAIPMAVYSSGSVKAQQLLFRHTNFGDLTKHFNHYFDTGVGHKREATSYLKISQELCLESKNILFLSDIGEELDAAKEIGMKTIQVIRDETTLPFHQHLQVETFKDIKWA